MRIDVRPAKKWDAILLEEGDKEKLIMFFGGLGMRIGITEQPFEFVRTTRYAKYTKIFIRDAYRIWYQRGLKDLTDTLPDTISLLKEITDGYENIICVGNSAGGYGALMFGSALQVNCVHAFSPQTFIDPQRDARYKQAGTAVKLEIPTILDVKPLMTGRTTYFLHYCGGDKLDRLHAERLRSSPNVRLFKYQCNSHVTAKYLRGRNLLSKIIECETAEDVHNQILSARRQPPPQ